MLIIVKLATTPLLILLSLLLTRVAGPAAGGILAGLPFISGPASIFICMEQGPAFAAEAAGAALLGVVASCAYCLAYARLAVRRAWPRCLAAGLAAFCLTAPLLGELAPPLPAAVALSLLAPLVALRCLPRPGEIAPPAGGGCGAGRIATQMICGGLAVLLLTLAARVAGPQWSGLLLTFPIVSSILTPFIHASCGGAAAVQTIRGLLSGFVGTSAFSAAAAFWLLPLGPVLGYTTSIAAAACAGALPPALRRLSRRIEESRATR